MTTARIRQRRLRNLQPVAVSFEAEELRPFRRFAAGRTGLIGCQEIIDASNA